MAELPERTRVYQNHHLDSNRWNWFTPREDDIIIATSYKAVTTFTQTIVGNLLFPDGNLPGPASFISPWLDFRPFPLELVFEQLEAQEHRRYIKTHTPLDGLPYYPDCKYLCVTRDPRDVFMSLLNHWDSHTEEFYPSMNNVPGLVGDPFPVFDGDVKRIWQDWITRSWFDWEIGGYPYWSHLSYALTFWNYRHLPNIKMLHFNDLLADLDGQMRDIATFLEIEVPEEHWPDVVRRCTFAEVKKDPGKVVGENIAFAFKGGADTFIHKGTNGRWAGVLDEEDLALYDEAMGKLPTDYSKWLAHGGPC
ncbi:MAG: sulfotransferase domain-containing protein [Pseudomonadota bacterium]